jgi:hypothetical protein
LNKTKAKLTLTKIDDKKRLFLLKYEETKWELTQGVLYNKKRKFFSYKV